jgi:hypothetical protein
MNTAVRQGRRIKMGKEAWRRRCLTAADLPGFEAWGALVNGVLVASLLTFQMVDCCEMISFQSHRDYLKARVNNALIFVVTQTMLNRHGIRSVFHGLHSLDAPASVDEFKLRMGYTAKPVRQRIIFRRCLKPLANNIIHKILIYLLDKDPGNQIIAKAEGFLRFHLQGERPLNEQDWPDVLMKYKQALLKGLIWEESILA